MYRKLLLATLFIAAILAFGLSRWTTPARVAVFQGYVEGEFVQVSPVIGGTLTQLSVARGDSVVKDAPLFTLDNTDELAARDQAKAQLTQSRNQLTNLTKGRRLPEIDVIQAQKAQAEAALRLARIELDRQQHLIGTVAFMRQQFDQADAAFRQNQARVAELTAQLSVAQMSQGRDDEIRAAENNVAALDASLQQAQWHLAQKALTAPATGLISDTYFNPGEAVAANQPVVSLLPPENIKIRFFVPEAVMPSLATGAHLSVRCDGCTAAIPARISFISPQAEYTPPVIYSRDQRARLVFMIEAKPNSPLSLRVGQPVDVTLSARP